MVFSFLSCVETVVLKYGDNTVVTWKLKGFCGTSKYFQIWYPFESLKMKHALYACTYSLEKHKNLYVNHKVLPLKEEASDSEYYKKYFGSFLFIYHTVISVRDS